MEERRVRPSVGRKGDGTIHRVGLTRHCLTSGSIQLPFALRDALPEGEIVVLDVDRDERFPLVSHPPRRLSGLREFFAAHELQVNDLLEIRPAEAELRLACVRSARSSRGEERGSAEAGATSPPGVAARPTADSESPGHVPATGRPTRAHPAVVERIGSVTVRRLGTGAFAPPSESTLRRRPAAAEDAGPVVGAPVAEELAAEARITDPEPGDTVPASGRSEGAPESRPADARRTDRSAPVASETPTTPARPSAPSGSAVRSEGPGRSRPAPPRGARRGEAGPAPAGDVHESDLVDDGQAASSAAWSVRDASDRARFRNTPPTAAAPSQRSVPSISGGTAASRDGAAPTHAPSPREASGPSERRDREEALSRAGDLRSRIVRWLLDPATPVIVQYEAVQERFDLSADVARDVLAGILESPPPSLRLTVLREGMIRVSRVTVVQEV